MFKKSIIVIALFRNKLIVSRVSSGGVKEIADVREYGWDEKTLDIIFLKIKDIYKTNSVYILFTREVSYVMRLSVPRELEISYKRQLILDSLLERIPEVLEDNDFDFKVITSSSEDENVLAFAPVTAIKKAVELAVQKSGLKVVVAEPEELAKTRNTNPIVGIALKEDISGRDDEVLNLQFRRENHTSINQEYTKKSGKRLRNISIIFILMAIISASIFYVLLRAELISL